MDRRECYGEMRKEWGLARLSPEVAFVCGIRRIAEMRDSSRLRLESLISLPLPGKGVVLLSFLLCSGFRTNQLPRKHLFLHRTLGKPSCRVRLPKGFLAQHHAHSHLLRGHRYSHRGIPIFAYQFSFAVSCDYRVVCIQPSLTVYQVWFCYGSKNEIGCWLIFVISFLFLSPHKRSGPVKFLNLVGRGAVPV